MVIRQGARAPISMAPQSSLQQNLYLPLCLSPSLSNHTKMHHLVTVIKFHNYIKSAFNLSNVLAWSINLYLFVVCINSVHHRWDLLDSKHFESFSDFGFSWGWCALIFMELYVSRKKLCQRHLWIHYWAQSYLVLYLFVTIDQNDHAYPQQYLHLKFAILSFNNTLTKLS